MGKRLVIKNLHKLNGWIFFGRFHFDKVIVGEWNYRFVFVDVAWGNPIYVTIELIRAGKWNGDESDWLYRLDYPGVVSEELVSSRSWSDLDNVKSAFSSILERNL